MNKALRLGTVTAVMLFITLFATGFTVGSSINISSNGEALTEQVWAVQVEAKPGESGSLSQDFEAAHGPYDENVKEENDPDVVKDDAYGVYKDDDGYFAVAKGEDYVGDYFHIEQEAGTTGGTVKRYIDISSPWSGAYLHEDMTVEGEATITETFELNNLEPGEAVVPEWYDLF